MTRISRYVMRQILGPFAFFTLVLMGIVWLFEALNILDVIINKGQSIGTFLQFAAYLTPSVIETVLPISLLCAVIYGLNRLKNDSELVVMWASGMSRWAVARPVLIVAMVTVALLYVLSIELTPMGKREFRDMSFELRDNLATALLQEGTFNTPTGDLTIYIRERTSADELAGILVHDSSDPKAPITYLAEQGRLVRDPDAPRIVMVNGTIQRLDPLSGAVSILDFDRYTFDLSQFTDSDSLLVHKPSSRPITELFQPGIYAKNDREVRRFRWELHMRLSNPIYALIYALLAFVALVNPRFSRQSQVWPVIGAASAAILIRAIGYFLRNQIKDDAMFVPALYGFLIVCLLVLLMLVPGERLFFKRASREPTVPAE